jgi:hypothetical protein
MVNLIKSSPCLNLYYALIYHFYEQGLSKSLSTVFCYFGPSLISTYHLWRQNEVISGIRLFVKIIEGERFQEKLHFFCESSITENMCPVKLQFKFSFVREGHFQKMLLKDCIGIYLVSNIVEAEISLLNFI